MSLSLSRRAFSLGLPAVALGAGALPLAARAAESQAFTPLARIEVGRFTVTALSDGHADMPYGYFPGRPACASCSTNTSSRTARAAS
jgi:hypothetical protein